MSRNIIHLHIPAFYVAVAKAVNPKLAGRPLAVVLPCSDRSIILSASFEAREEGVYKGIPLSEGVKRCPDLTVLTLDIKLVRNAGRALAELVAGYTPLWETSRPGHIYLDVTGTGRLWGEAKDVGYRVGHEAKALLSLQGAVGVAGNKMISRIASGVTPSGGLLDVKHGDEPSFISPMKVQVVPGIGRSRLRILNEELGITRVRELSSLDLGSLELIFGREAPVIHQRAQGIDPTPVYPVSAQPVISEEITLPHGENDDRRLLSNFYGLVEKCAYRIRRREFVPGRIGILIRHSDHTEIKRQSRLTANGLWDIDVYKILEDLFLKTCRRRVGVRFIRVCFRDFSYPDPQLPLFHVLSPVREKRSLAVNAMDKIRDRYGDNAIRYGRAGMVLTRRSST